MKLPEKRSLRSSSRRNLSYATSRRRGRRPSLVRTVLAGLTSLLRAIAFLIMATFLLRGLHGVWQLSLGRDRPCEHRCFLQEWSERRRLPAAKVDPVTRTAGEFRDLFDAFAATWLPAADK